MLIRYTAPDPKLENVTRFPLPQKKSLAMADNVLPVLNHTVPEETRVQLAKILDDSALVVMRGVINTHDQAVLDTISISPASVSSKPANNQHYIIRFFGNNLSYMENLNQLKIDAIRLDCTLIGFDYRGVNNSKKLPERFVDLVVDGCAQVQRLLDQGISPNKIVLDGYSLGGMVAVITAAIFHDKGMPVNIWCDRTIASLSLAGAEYYHARLPWLLKGKLTKLMLLKTAAQQLGGWEIGEMVVDAYNSIPGTHKCSMVVAEKSAHLQGDGIHAPQVFLNSKIKAHEKSLGFSTREKVAFPSAVTLFTPYSQKRVVGHTAPRNCLVSANDPSKTGQDLFDGFIRKLQG